MRKTQSKIRSWVSAAEISCAVLIAGWAGHLAVYFIGLETARSELVQWEDSFHLLTPAAARLNGPANDVFRHLDVATQRARYQELRAAFEETLGKVQRSPLHSPVSQSVWLDFRRGLRRDWIVELQSLVQSQSEETERVFNCLDASYDASARGGSELSGGQRHEAEIAMANSDRLSQEMMDLISDVNGGVRQVDGELLRRSRVTIYEISLLTIASFALALLAFISLRRLRSITLQRDRLHAELIKSEEQHRAVVDHAADGIITISERGLIESFNTAAQKIFGYEADEVLGRNVSMLMHAPERDQHDHYLAEYLRTGKQKIIGMRREVVARRKDGRDIPVEIHISKSLVRDRRFFTGIVRDLTDSKRNEHALREANERLVCGIKRMEDHSRELTLLTEMGQLLETTARSDEAYEVIANYSERLFPGWSGKLARVSASGNLTESLLGWGTFRSRDLVFAPHDCWALGTGRSYIVEDGQSGLVCRHLSACSPAASLCIPLVARSELLGVFCLVREGGRSSSTPRGGEIGAVAALPPIPSDQERQAGPVQNRSVTTTTPLEMESVKQLAMALTNQVSLALSNLQLRETLRDQALRDPLTGLFNRRYMEVLFERDLHRAIRRDVPVSAIMLDVDHFKRFNDTHGHAAGDALLRRFGGFLKAMCRGEDIPCRYGGEEFAVFLPETPLAVAHERAEQIRESAKQLVIEHRSERLGPVTISVGVSAFPDHGSEPEDLIRAADDALYRAKRQGRDRVQLAQASPCYQTCDVEPVALSV